MVAVEIIWFEITFLGLNMRNLVEDKKWITLKEAAERMNLAYDYALRTFLSWEKFGIKAYRPLNGRKWMFKVEEIDRHIEASCIN